MLPDFIDQYPISPIRATESRSRLGNHLQSPLGFLKRHHEVDHELTALVTRRPPHDWLSMIGMLGILIAFGHSILAMSGEETLAQVYREVESPKLKNFKRAAFIVFVYSLVLTAGISFLAVMLIPER